MEIQFQFWKRGIFRKVKENSGIERRRTCSKPHNTIPLFDTDTAEKGRLQSETNYLPKYSISLGNSIQSVTAMNLLPLTSYILAAILAR